MNAGGGPGASSAPQGFLRGAGFFENCALLALASRAAARRELHNMGPGHLEPERDVSPPWDAEEKPEVHRKTGFATALEGFPPMLHQSLRR